MQEYEWESTLKNHDVSFSLKGFIHTLVLLLNQLVVAVVFSCTNFFFFKLFSCNKSKLFDEHNCVLRCAFEVFPIFSSLFFFYK